MSKAVKLGEIGNFVSGGTPSRKHPEYFEGSIPWVSTPALNGGMIDEADAVQMITEQAIASSATKLLPPRSLLIGVRVGVGKTAVNLVPMCTNQDIVAITGVDESLWDIRYVSYAVQAKSSYLVSQKQGATITGITSKLLKGVEIQQRSIEDQRCCVRMLDSVKDRIKDASDGIEKLDELVKSRFVEMFGDQKTNSSELPTVKLGDTAFVGSSKRVFKDELVEEGIPFYRGTEVGALAFGNSINPELFITQQHYEELVGHTGKPEIGDLLMPSICPDGQIWLVDTDAPFYFKDGRVLWVRPDRSVFDSTYLQYAMRNRFIADFESFASGTTFAELKIFILKNLVVALPPLALQQEFAAFVQQVDKLKFDYQNN